MSLKFTREDSVRAVMQAGVVWGALMVIGRGDLDEAMSELVSFLYAAVAAAPDEAGAAHTRSESPDDDDVPF